MRVEYVKVCHITSLSNREGTPKMKELSDVDAT